jgi:hypothetical protein
MAVASAAAALAGDAWPVSATPPQHPPRRDGSRDSPRGATAARARQHTRQPPMLRCDSRRGWVYRLPMPLKGQALRVSIKGGMRTLPLIFRSLRCSRVQPYRDITEFHKVTQNFNPTLARVAGNHPRSTQAVRRPEVSRLRPPVRTSSMGTAVYHDGGTINMLLTMSLDWGL